MGGPIALGFLVWCYYRVQNDPTLKAPAKMSLDVLESDKPPKDWENLDDFPETEESEGAEDGEKDEDESSDEEGKAHGHAHSHDGGHGHSHAQGKGKHTHSHGPDDEEDEMKIKLGVGPQGVKGRPNQGRPDPRTMKLMLLESLREKKNK